MSASENPASIAGLWRGEGKGRATEASLSVDASGIATVVSEGNVVVASAPLARATISARVGNIPRHVSFAGIGNFETRDNDGVDKIAGGDIRAGSLVHGLEAFRPRLIAVVALTVALCYALYRFAVPLLVEVAIAVTPPVVTELMSQGAMLSLDQSIFEPTKLPPERQKELSDRFATIAALTPRGMAARAGSQKPAYTLNFRGGGVIGPNAFALPDGTIVLTDELVEMAKDDDMIVGVLAHEIGHVDHEHSLRQLYRAAGVATLIMLIGGDIGAGTEDLLVQGAALISLSHSRSAEREADRFSVELMHRAGHDPEAIARFFELLRDRLGDKGGSDFLSTHPATPERILETRRYAREVAGNPP